MLQQFIYIKGLAGPFTLRAERIDFTCISGHALTLGLWLRNYNKDILIIFQIHCVIVSGLFSRFFFLVIPRCLSPL